jgi:hypothetical protein
MSAKRSLLFESCEAVPFKKSGDKMSMSGDFGDRVIVHCGQQNFDQNSGRRSRK